MMNYNKLYEAFLKHSLHIAFSIAISTFVQQLVKKLVTVCKVEIF